LELIPNLFQFNTLQTSTSSIKERSYKIRIDWTFGSVKILLHESKFLEWASAIFEAVNNKANNSNCWQLSAKPFLPTFSDPKVIF
jgi:hypothetical protein